MQDAVDADVQVAHGAIHGAHARRAVAYVPAGHAARQLPPYRTAFASVQVAHAPPSTHVAHPGAQAVQVSEFAVEA